MRHGEELLTLCYELIALDIKIILAVDYAFALSKEGSRVIEELKFLKQNITFATHMHPWNTPPFINYLNDSEKYSFPGNLEPKIEFEKLSNITNLMHSITGEQPKIYLAGRYGIGENTHSILKSLDYKFDLSISAHSDFSLNGGPDFTEFDNNHFSIENITYIPHTVGFVSHFQLITNIFNRIKNLHKRLNSNILGKICLKMLGVKRVRLSSEGFNPQELEKLCDSLITNEIEYLLFSIHSSSLFPKNTYYTKTKEECTELHKNTVKIINYLVFEKKLKPSFLN